MRDALTGRSRRRPIGVSTLSANCMRRFETKEASREAGSLVLRLKGPIVILRLKSSARLIGGRSQVRTDSKFIPAGCGTFSAALWRGLASHPPKNKIAAVITPPAVNPAPSGDRKILNQAQPLIRQGKAPRADSAA